MAVTSNEPKVIATSRYSINETCELLGITRKTLQKYTMFGLIKCGFRKATMKKFYTGLEIMKFWRTAVQLKIVFFCRLENKRALTRIILPQARRFRLSEFGGDSSI